VGKLRQILGEDHPDTIISMYNLALTYAELGRLDEAAQIYEQAL